MPGRPACGVASHWLCDLALGAKVEVVGPFGSTFLMPDDPDADLLMICTGTGVSPFRGFTHRRRRTSPEARGKLFLFYGAPSAEDLPYRGPLQKYVQAELHRELVYSRSEGCEREYVQDRLRQRAGEIAGIMRKDSTHIYDLGGHIVKSRYTPLQVMMASVDEQGSPYHELLGTADSVDGDAGGGGRPALGAARGPGRPAELFAARRRSPRAVYVMTDGGALPAWFSRTVAGLRDAGWLAATVTTGQSFGGDLEAVTVHTRAARRPARGRRRRGDRRAGARQPRHRDPVGLLRRGGRRGGQRGGGARRTPGGVAAAVGRRPAATPPGRLPPQPDRLRPRGARRVPTWRSPNSPSRAASRVAADVAPLASRAPAGHVPVDGLESALRACPVAAVHHGPRP